MQTAAIRRRWAGQTKMFPLVRLKSEVISNLAKFGKLETSCCQHCGLFLTHCFCTTAKNKSA